MASGEAQAMIHGLCRGRGTSWHLP